MHDLVVTGGNLNLNFAREYIKTLSYDKVFAVDKGLEYADQLGITPSLIIGDFDTVDPSVLFKYENIIRSENSNVKIIRHPVKKDMTDTELALQQASLEHFLKVTILGATGSRLDHDFLPVMGRMGIEAVIVDENNRIRLLDSDCNMNDITIYKDKQFGRYISIIPLTDKVEGVVMSGVEYPLDNAAIYKGKGLTVSNVIIEKAAHIHIDSGAALVIESRD